MTKWQLCALLALQWPLAAANPSLTTCECKWPDTTQVGMCDSPPKMCLYCMDTLAFMYYGPENSPSLGCLIAGRNPDVCTRVGAEIEVRSRVP